ncbi:type VI secretion system baseplate protein IglJ [Francisella sp. LA112445]|uniref:type VI secretion system baseplate protein IglJ n=1 Tax=Francisella sp. LA112445 TaxID=1395624 RepID=UPI001FD9DDDC|nr:type VI secretion system baseplate protein IglJ [Francisella sp. LA112445]
MMFIEKNTEIENIENLNNICHKLSLNNLLSILASYQLEIKNIELIPILMNSVSNTTILNISNINGIVYIEINVFKLQLFSNLETKYQDYIKNNNNRAISVLKDGIKIMLYRYTLRTKKLYQLTQHNPYVHAATPYTLEKIINHLYKIFSEDYCTVINYEKKKINIKRKPSSVGHDDIGLIFLGGHIPSFIYLIKINLILLYRNETVIDNIKLQLIDFEKKIKNKLIKIELKISIENPKSNIQYLGSCSI